MAFHRVQLLQENTLTGYEECFFERLNKITFSTESKTNWEPAITAVSGYINTSNPITYIPDSNNTSQFTIDRDGFLYFAIIHEHSSVHTGNISLTCNGDAIWGSDFTSISNYTQLAHVAMYVHLNDRIIVSGGLRAYLKLLQFRY